MDFVIEGIERKVCRGMENGECGIQVVISVEDKGPGAKKSKRKMKRSWGEWSRKEGQGDRIVDFLGLWFGPRDKSVAAGDQNRGEKGVSSWERKKSC
jgi:hypothetical protein